jgi:hypothetical protein
LSTGEYSTATFSLTKTLDVPSVRLVAPAPDHGMLEMQLFLTRV